MVETDIVIQSISLPQQQEEIYSISLGQRLSVANCQGAKLNRAHEKVSLTENELVVHLHAGDLFVQKYRLILEISSIVRIKRYNITFIYIKIYLKC